jgi:hypothetical protein
MSTKSQIETNRRNAAKSTGPTSVEGKAVSSMNAPKSGIHTESAILDNIIRDTWLLIRFFRIDAEIIDYFTAG